MNARIEEIRIQNFRAIENARLTLSDLTFLVGRNGAGKSTVLDAFEFIREALTDNLPNALDRRNGFLGLINRRASEGAPLALAIVMSANVGAQPVRMLYGFRLRNLAGDIEEVLRVRPKSTLGFTRHNKLFESGANVWPGIPAARLLLPLIVSNELWQLAYDALTGMRAYELIPQSMAAPVPIRNPTTLVKTGANAGDVLEDVRTRPEALEVILRTLQTVTPGIAGVSTRVVLAQRLLDFTQQVAGASTLFEANEVSLGTLRALGILLALEQQPEPSLVLIDEVEDSIHPGALEAILESIEIASERFPVVLTTHSPEVLTTRQATSDRVRIVQWKGGVSRLYPLSADTKESIDPVTSAGDLLRINALWPSDAPDVFAGDILELGRMNERSLICIVEGVGECVAVPTVVNRVLEHLRRQRKLTADPDRVICTKSGDRITRPYDPARELGIEYFVQRAARAKPGGILVVVDAEERCLKRDPSLPPLGTDLRQRAAPFAGSIPLGVVVANRMFETWFLADFQSLRARKYFPATARLPQWRTPETLAGCKGWMKAILGRPYHEPSDQPLLTEHLSLPLHPAMQRRAPSYWKLFREIDKLSR